MYPNAEDSAQQRHTDVTGKIAALEDVRKDSLFSQLPEAQRDYVEKRLKELRDYQEYEQKIANVPSLSEVRSDEQLQTTRNKVVALDVPGVYAVEWSHTDAGKRHLELLADLQSLEMAVHATRRNYLLLVDAGKDVLRTADAPQLPRRAREVIERGTKLPTPERDREKPVPDSPRITYATVFEFAAVKDALKAWAKVREELQPLTLTPQP